MSCSAWVIHLLIYTDGFPDPPAWYVNSTTQPASPPPPPPLSIPSEPMVPIMTGGEGETHLLCTAHPSIRWESINVKISMKYSSKGLWKSYLCIPFLGIARPQSQFPHSCVWAIYIFPGSVNIFPAAEQADRLWEYINRSQTLERGNQDCDRAIPVLGIFVSNFRYWFFAVCHERIRMWFYL